MPVIPVIPYCNIYGINSKKPISHSRVHGLCENIPPIQVLIPLSAAPARADGARTQKRPGRNLSGRAFLHDAEEQILRKSGGIRRKNLTAAQYFRSRHRTAPCPSHSGRTPRFGRCPGFSLKMNCSQRRLRAFALCQAGVDLVDQAGQIRNARNHIMRARLAEGAAQLLLAAAELVGGQCRRFLGGQA